MIELILISGQVSPTSGTTSGITLDELSAILSGNYYTISEVDTKYNQLIDYTDDKVKNLGTVFSWKGFKETYDDLPDATLSSVNKGDIYSVKDEDNLQYVCVSGTDGKYWEQFGQNLKLYGYYTKEQVNTISSTLQSEITGKADSATSLTGYGIADAKIENGTITLGENQITPLTSYTLPTASETTLGCIKIGDSLSIDSENKLNVKYSGKNLSKVSGIKLYNSTLDLCSSLFQSHEAYTGDIFMGNVWLTDSPSLLPSMQADIVIKVVSAPTDYTSQDKDTVYLLELHADATEYTWETEFFKQANKSCTISSLFYGDFDYPWYAKLLAPISVYNEQKSLKKLSPEFRAAKYSELKTVSSSIKTYSAGSGLTLSENQFSIDYTDTNTANKLVKLNDDGKISTDLLDLSNYYKSSQIDSLLTGKADNIKSSVNVEISDKKFYISGEPNKIFLLNLSGQQSGLSGIVSTLTDDFPQTFEIWITLDDIISYSLENVCWINSDNICKKENEGPEMTVSGAVYHIVCQKTNKQINANLAYIEQ